MGQQARVYQRFIVFRQIPLFRSSKYHFFKTFCSGALFFLWRNSVSRKFVQLFDWKWVNEQGSIRSHQFSAKFHCFGLRNGILLKILVSVLLFFCAKIQIRINLFNLLMGNGSTSRTPEEVHRLSTNSIISASEKASFWKFS